MSLLTLIIIIVVGGLCAGLSTMMPKPGSLPMAAYKSEAGRRNAMLMINLKDNKYTLMSVTTGAIPNPESEGGTVVIKGRLDEDGSEIILTSAVDGATRTLVFERGGAWCTQETEGIRENRSIRDMNFKRTT